MSVVQLNKNFENAAEILVLGLPKGGRTLGGSDTDFLADAGFAVPASKKTRVDYYMLEDRRDLGMAVKAFDMKSYDPITFIGRGSMDVALLGRDMVKEGNAALRGNKQRGVPEILDLDMVPCALALAVREGDNARTLEDLNGRTVATKYVGALKKWAQANNVEFAEIVKMGGSIESANALDPNITVICDIIGTGKSLVDNGWRPLGLDESLWAPVRQDQSFSKLPYSTLSQVTGMVSLSDVVMVRSPNRLSDEKEAAILSLRDRFMEASIKRGCNPRLINNEALWDNKVVAPRKPAVAAPAAPAPGFAGHLAARGW